LEPSLERPQGRLLDPEADEERQAPLQATTPPRPRAPRWRGGSRTWATP
jgi:hypothetical protein